MTSVCSTTVFQDGVLPGVPTGIQITGSYTRVTHNGSGLPRRHRRRAPRVCCRARSSQTVQTGLTPQQPKSDRRLAGWRTAGYLPVAPAIVGRGKDTKKGATGQVLTLIWFFVCSNRRSVRVARNQKVCDERVPCTACGLHFTFAECASDHGHVHGQGKKKIRVPQAGSLILAFRRARSDPSLSLSRKRQRGPPPFLSFSSILMVKAMAIPLIIKFTKMVATMCCARGPTTRSYTDETSLPSSLLRGHQSSKAVSLGLGLGLGATIVRSTWNAVSTESRWVADKLLSFASIFRSQTASCTAHSSSMFTFYSAAR